MTKFNLHFENNCNLSKRLLAIIGLNGIKYEIMNEYWTIQG